MCERTRTKKERTITVNTSEYIRFPLFWAHVFHPFSRLERVSSTAVPPFLESGRMEEYSTYRVVPYWRRNS